MVISQDALELLHLLSMQKISHNEIATKIKWDLKIIEKCLTELQDKKCLTANGLLTPVGKEIIVKYPPQKKDFNINLNAFNI